MANDLPVEQRKCHYCFQMFPKDEMLEDKARLFACDKCYKQQIEKENSSLIKRIEKPIMIIVGIPLILAILIFSFMVGIVMPVAFIAEWKDERKKEKLC